MNDPKKQYQKNKETILNTKGITEAQQKNYLLNNWLNYIQESISEEVQKQNAFNWYKSLSKKSA